VKLTNNRLYFDYNATAPLAKSVQDYFANGALAFGNPSSIHTEGRQARTLIRETSDYLFQIFGLPSSEFNLFFHSGASEGINGLVMGASWKALQDKVPFHFFCFQSDHSAVVKQREHLECWGHQGHSLPVNSNGGLEVELIKKEIGKHSGQKWLNFTHVNNETGVVWDLAKAIEIKRETGCFVHVDAVQTPGKIEQWKKLHPELDAYTFSAHKFGSLKGVGFTFVKKSVALLPFILGGGQQSNLRSGTENAMGIYSVKLALEELDKKFASKRSEKLKNYFEQQLKIILNENKKSFRINGEGEQRNLNTVNVSFAAGTKSELMIAALDMASLSVSSGSACSTGSSIPSRVLLAMGREEKEAKSSLRFSWSPTISEAEIEEALKIIRKSLIPLL